MEVIEKKEVNITSNTNLGYSIYMVILFLLCLNYCICTCRCNGTLIWVYSGMVGIGLSTVWHVDLSIQSPAWDFRLVLSMALWLDLSNDNHIAVGCYAAPDMSQHHLDLLGCCGCQSMFLSGWHYSNLACFLCWVLSLWCCRQVLPAECRR